MRESRAGMMDRKINIVTDLAGKRFVLINEIRF